jgi:hypothetical protein
MLTGEENPHEYGSIWSDKREISHKLRYSLSSRCQLDEEDEARVASLVAEIKPEIPLLAVQITKSNVNGSHPSLVTCLDPIVDWISLCLIC